MNNIQDNQGPPKSVLNAMAKQCTCCYLCGQSRPCDGVMAGGMCDEMCDCGEDDQYEYEFTDDE